MMIGLLEAISDQKFDEGVEVGLAYKRRLKLLAERLTQEGKADMLSKVIRNDELFEVLCKEYGIEI